MIGDSRASSGLEWGIEVESIVLEIIGDADEIEEEKLLDLLESRQELQTMRAEFAEFVQQIPEIRKRNNSKNTTPRNTIRGEMRILLDDLTSGAYHSGQTECQKLEKRTEYGDGNARIFIRCIANDRALR